ncbi:hypothetical protein C7M29_01922 [Bacillus subtilis]|nr:hypothetical protein C7M29_01922 [Bacillus subtilis]
MKAVTYDTDPELAYIYVLPPKKNRNVRTEELRVNVIVSCWISAKMAKSLDSNVLVRQHTSVPHLPGNPGYM